jgi:hypothetical protein
VIAAGNGRATAREERRPPRRRPFDPAPRPGLGLTDFRRICDNGLGDGHNSFPHSAAWFQGRFYIGITRSNFQMLKVQKIFQDLPVYAWPVEGPDDREGLYTLDRRAQIWAYDPLSDRWQYVLRSPLVTGTTGEDVARETGYRAMAVFQGDSDPEPALYVATWAVSRSPGSLVLRSRDGAEFTPVSEYGILKGLPITATRVLVPFKGRLFTSPTGTRGFDVNFVINVSGVPVIYETRDPASGEWTPACESGFGDPTNLGIFMLSVFNEQLYAGTFNNRGFQVWRSDCAGDPPYRWTKVIDEGASRGPLNQVVISMLGFGGALYVGTAIQNGGNDRTNNIGPAASELIRIWPDDSWDLIVGSPRVTPHGKKIPLSGFAPGFGNLFNGYFWSMAVHEGWLYLGTMDSTIWLSWLRPDAYQDHVSRFFERVGAENIVANEAGCDLWRSADGENWMPVTRTGFDNHYNLGIRNLVSTPHGLFVGVANPFGPRVAVPRGGTWQYEDNPRGGLEVWRGSTRREES